MASIDVDRQLIFIKALRCVARRYRSEGIQRSLASDPAQLAEDRRLLLQLLKSGALSGVELGAPPPERAGLLHRGIHSAILVHAPQKNSSFW